jgi:hypothetical protein
MPYASKQDLYDNQLKHRLENKRRVWDYLLSHSCVDCGEADPIVLEFDHVRGVKLMNVARMTSGSTYSWNKIEAEIAKCDVRCANCHRRKTAIESSFWSPALESNQARQV